MHFSALFLLPLLAAADSQIPLAEKAQGWFDKAKAYIPSAVPNPIDAGAAKVAARVVERINNRNWQRKLSPKLDTEEEWLVYLTGGNKSCFGQCGPVDLAWNESVPLLASLPQPAGSAPLHLGIIDCEKDEVLCTGWAASLPSVYHFAVPRQSDAKPKIPIHIIPLNISTISIADITSIPTYTESRYAEYPEYTGILHPFDGLLAKFGLQEPFAYMMWVLGNTPGWLMMIGISFVSRQIVSRRLGGGQGSQTAADEPAEPAPPVPAPQAGSAGRATGAGTPKSGGGRKRK